MKRKKIVIGMLLIIAILVVLGIVAVVIANTDPQAENAYDVALVVGATDWLSVYATFASSLVAALIAIVGVWWSLSENQKQYHQDQINQSLPYFIAQLYKHKSDYNPFLPRTSEEETNDVFVSEMTQNAEDIQYEEYLQDEVVCVLTNGKKNWKTDFSKKQWQLVKQEGMYNRKTGVNEFSLCRANLAFAIIDFENVGRGAATFVKIGLNRKGEKYDYITMPARKVGESLRIRILSTDCSEKDLGGYDLDILYIDIFNNVYRQRFPFQITKAENHAFGCSISYEGKQECFSTWDALISTEGK